MVAQGDAEMRRRPAILVTGQEIAPEAAALMASRGCEVYYVPLYASAEQLAEVAARHAVDGIIARGGQVAAGVIEASPRLKVIAKHGSGVDNIDIEAASRRGVPVLRAVAANSQAVAEHAFALMAALTKDLFPLDAQIRNGRWSKAGHRGRDLAGLTLGIVGFGEIGRRLAGMAGAFGMPVLAHDPQFPSDAIDVNVTRIDDLDALLTSSDIVSLHCPLTAQTRHMIGAARLAAMKPGAIIINTARGGIIDERALVEALRDGRIAGAGLDSFEQEPPASDNPLWALPNVILTPHVAGVTQGAVREMGVQATRHVLGVLAGEPPEPRCLANPDYRSGRSARADT
jgi:D-3-phosphoglycerate dehydrogenase